VLICDGLIQQFVGLGVCVCVCVCGCVRACVLDVCV